MRYARLFADQTGESHFEEIEIEFTQPITCNQPRRSIIPRRLPSSQFAFMRAPAGWASEFHVSSARNIFVVLSGEWEVTASDGFAVGSALLVEETTGKGHSSRVMIKRNLCRSWSPSSSETKELTSAVIGIKFAPQSFHPAKGDPDRDFQITKTNARAAAARSGLGNS